MPVDLCTRLLRELDRPLALRLSYSGESGNCPGLAQALDSARATGAQVELVTALISVPDAIVKEMAERLDRSRRSHGRVAGQNAETGENAGECSPSGAGRFTCARYAAG